MTIAPAIAMAMLLKTTRVRGFTLIEVLIALVVLSVGLLGAAAMLLASLRGQADALRQVAAANLVHDMAERIRANPHGGALYGNANLLVAPAGCGAAAPCKVGERAAADLAHFALSAAGAFPGPDTTPGVTFEPATGPASPDRYVITLRWRDAQSASDADEVAQQVLTLLPVAG